MKRPAVEEFKRLTSTPAHTWGMADSDVVELCDWILHLEANLKNLARQKTTDELKAEGEQEYDDADFEGGYDALIHIARRAIATAA